MTSNKEISRRIEENIYVYYSMTLLAWIAFALMLFSIAMGDQILQKVVTIYPDFSLPAFFVPWFLLVITSVQKLQKETVKLSLQMWVLKTTLPIFIFILPFFSTFLSIEKGVLDRSNQLINNNVVLLGFEPYCIYLAVIVLFAMHFLPAFIKKT